MIFSLIACVDNFLSLFIHFTSRHVTLLLLKNFRLVPSYSPHQATRLCLVSTLFLRAPSTKLSNHLPLAHLRNSEYCKDPARALEKNYSPR